MGGADLRVGLVLGAGGVLGGAWLTGALQALAVETEWDPASADQIVGTSAGAMMSALLAAGVPPWFMVAHSSGESFDGLVGADGRAAAGADRAAGARFGLHRGWPPIGPGSWRLALRSALRPMRHSPTAVVAGWLPRGFISTEPLKETIRRVVPHGWVEHPNLWIVACDYASSRRVAFGRADAPRADLADAVAASCAIPGFYHPVSIDGRRYVDGGMYSTSNLDIVREADLDLVICLNPTSSLHPTRAWNPADRLAAVVRRAAGRRLGSEASRLRSLGVEVVLVQPTAADLAVMGPNLMSRRNRHAVIETAIETVSRQLREHDVRARLAGLPAGAAHKIRRPSGPPSTWPVTILPAARDDAA
ncbi:MAG TPA: patatin-like phospholipase family protein [Solirubrobacteraceae bacterium]|nr:patatin-like phospholipase family protein [Solirubrobacteraceae bacterium]